MQAKPSLEARALQLLAQRDQSRVELRQKLLRHAQRAAVGSAGIDDSDGDRQRGEVEAVLDWLEANRYLSAERFAESRVNARQRRFGNLRIRSELAQHGVTLAPDGLRELAETELQRAAAVRARRFAVAPVDAAGWAAQTRFLAGRGFSPEVIGRLLRQLRDGSG